MFRCKSGFIGPTCVHSNPCMNRSCNAELDRGHCTAYISGNEYVGKCECKVGYAGLTCELITQCNAINNERPCENGGKCIEHNNQQYSCQCPPNFTGKLEYS